MVMGESANSLVEREQLATIMAVQEYSFLQDQNLIRQDINDCLKIRPMCLALAKLELEELHLLKTFLVIFNL